ncbi:MerR family DNA-binding transcriptional regulator [Leifsonia poae]|uniref:MerR family DNA-binding transcriptional regulator n=1 Tax=Leifsonia poae TaxID=110933 RepID=UPI003D676C21
MTETAGTMSISDVAERTGLSTHTLRYYEREGLMFAPWIVHPRPIDGTRRRM